MTARKNRGVTLAAIQRSWPPAVNVEHGARAHVSRATAYASIGDGTFPAEDDQGPRAAARADRDA